MKKNMGTADRVIRLVVALALIALVFGGALSGITAYVVVALAVVFTLTSFISFCPLYLPFGISTLGKKH